MTDLRKNVKLMLLSQSLCVKPIRGSKCFTKILCMDKYAFLLAKVYNVFQFRMDVEWDGVDFSFVSQENNDMRSIRFELSYEQAERFMKMLNPDSFHVNVMDDNIESEYFSLIPLTSGKLAFNVWRRDVIPDVLKIHWKRLDELTCCPELLELIDAWMTELKEFDKLTVRDVTNNARLAVCLKQKTKVLNLSLHGFHSGDLPLSHAVVNGTTEECCLEIEFTSLERIMLFVNVLATACQKLERFELSVCISNRGTYGTFDDFLNAIAEDYEKCVGVVDSLKDSSFTSNVDLSTNRLRVNFTLPDDWKDQLVARLGIGEHDIELIDIDYPEEGQICLAGKRGKAEFTFSAYFERYYHRTSARDLYDRYD